MSSIKIVSDGPGPQSRSQTASAPAWVARPVAPDLDSVAIASGEGAVVEDVDGNRLLDLTGGLGCLAVGHCHPRVVEAVRQQALKFLHTDYSVIPYDLYHRLAEAVSHHCGGGRKVAFFNSGPRRSRTPSRSPERSRAGRASSVSRAPSTAAPT